MRSLINYSIIEIDDLSTLNEVCRGLYARCADREIVTRLTLFSTCVSNEEYAMRLSQFKGDVESVWGDARPVVSHVAQQVLSSLAVVEVHSYIADGGESVTYRDYDFGGRSISVRGDYGRLLFVGELQSDVVSCTIEEQAYGVFERVQSIFDGEAMPYNSIVRQWNYVEQITGYEGCNQHYQLLNNARSKFYSQTQWVDGYPAATGIGADYGGVNVDIDALLDGGDGRSVITPIDNKLQVAAHAYSEEVLFDANRDKATPKFERAKSLDVEGFGSMTYISGTAAIRGEASVANLDAVEQSENTVENMEQLVDAGAQYELLRVYLKYRDDYRAVEQFLSQRFPTTRLIYLECDVCRDELLVEIEGIATTIIN